MPSLQKKFIYCSALSFPLDKTVRFALSLQVHASLRDWLKINVSPEVADSTRIIYGGIHFLSSCLINMHHLLSHLGDYSHSSSYRLCDCCKLQRAGGEARCWRFPCWWCFFKGNEKSRKTVYVSCIFVYIKDNKMTMSGLINNLSCWLILPPILSVAWVHRHHQLGHREVCLRCPGPLPPGVEICWIGSDLFSLLCTLVIWADTAFPTPSVFWS